MSKVPIEIEDYFHGQSPADLRMIRSALRQANIQVPSGNHLTVESEEESSFVATLRKRLDLARDVRLAICRRYPQLRRHQSQWITKLQISILKGGLEGGTLDIMGWLRSRCRNTTLPMFPLLTDLFTKLRLLPPLPLDFVAYRAKQIHRMIKLSRWEGIDSDDQEVVRNFLYHIDARYSGGTANNYKFAITRLTKAMNAAGLTSLQDVLPEHINTVVRTLNECGVTRNHQAAVLGHIKQLFVWLCEERGHSNCPVLRRHFPKPSRSETTPLTPEEISTIRSTLDERYVGSMVRALFYLIYLTGLRPMEALSVKIVDIERERNDLFVARGKGGKTGHVPIISYAFDRIDEWLSASPLPKRCKHVFHHHGLQISPSQAKHLREELSKAAQITFTWRQLRTTFATRLAEYGVGPFAIRDLLRHSQLSSVMAYIKLADPVVRDSYAKFSEQLDAAPGESDPTTLGTAIDLLDAEDTRKERAR